MQHTNRFVSPTRKQWSQIIPRSRVGLTAIRSRRGFTLIELLVVISIIGILAALLSGAIQRTRITQMVKNTESTVAKLQTGVDNQVKAIADAVKKERRESSLDFNKLLQYCDNDPDRVEALLMYIRLRQNLPYSLADTSNGTLTFSVGPPPGTPILIVSQPQAFKALNGIAASGDADRVSAAFLYIALSQRTLLGNSFDSDAATSGSQLDIPLGTGLCKVYTDGFTNPIGYRLASSTAGMGQPASVAILPELAGAPYVTFGIVGGVKGEVDPFDPLGKLSNWPTGKSNGFQAIFQQYLGVVFDGKNKRMIVYSAGMNRKYENLGGDDILGHRLISIGQKGSK